MWQLWLALNLVMFISYGGIMLAFSMPLIRSGQFGTNLLGAATSAMFLTCSVHHGAHSLHLLLPHLGYQVEHGRALQAAAIWPIVSWDIVTAVAAVYYWKLRTGYGVLLTGATIFEDLKAQQRRALEINDSIVQGLTVAQMALAIDDKQRSRDAMHSTLISARKIIADLMGDVAPGSLVRAEPALVTHGGNDLDAGSGPPASESRGV